MDERSTAFALEATRLSYTPTPEPVHTPARDGPLLREVWPTAPAGTRPVTRLLFRPPRPTWPEGPDTIWQLDLTSGQMQQLLELPNGARDPNSFAASPDGQYLVFTVKRSLERVSLLTPEGREYELTRSAIPDEPPCGVQYAWSPEGLRLAYVLPAGIAPGTINQLVVLDVASSAPPRLLAQQQGLQLIGWRGPNQVLFGTFTSPNNLALVGVEPTQGLTTTLAQLPAYLGCRQLSPDGQRLLLAEKRESAYLVDLHTGTFTLTTQPDALRLWAPDSQTLLINATLPNRRVRLRDATSGETRTWLTLAPPLPDSYDFELRAVAPDGRFLVGCAWRREPYGPQTTWVYAVEQDRWTQIASGRWCAAVGGWLTTP